MDSYKLKKVLLSVLGVSLVAGWWALSFSMSSAPTTPDSVHFIANNQHGMTVYISRLQYNLLHYVFPPTLLIFAIISFFILRKKPN
jgi:hypothetical protein